MDVKVKWHQEPIPESLSVRQVYGLLFNDEGRILAQIDKGRFNLPGGTPEADENLYETLARECLEESQVEIADASYLGYVHVVENRPNGPDEYAQVRFVGRIKALRDQAADIATGVKYERVLLDPETLIGKLAWGEHGKQQIEAAKSLANQLYRKRSSGR